MYTGSHIDLRFLSLQVCIAVSYCASGDMLGGGGGEHVGGLCVVVCIVFFSVFFCVCVLQLSVCSHGLLLLWNTFEAIYLVLSS